MTRASTKRSGRALALSLAFYLAALPGCALRGLDFFQDERITITAPRDRTEVTLPVTVTWRVTGFKVTGKDGSRRNDAGLFGIYIDRAPQPPQRTAEWMFRDDEGCRINPSCPSLEFLAAQNIFSTSDKSFTIETLPPPPTNVVQRRELHDVTIVLLNGRGERIGESAFRVEFEVKRGR